MLQIILNHFDQLRSAKICTVNNLPEVQLSQPLFLIVTKLMTVILSHYITKHIEPLCWTKKHKHAVNNLPEMKLLNLTCVLIVTELTTVILIHYIYYKSY